MPDRDPKNPNGCTGPRTPRGKASASQNATTHGLCSKIIVLPDEDSSAWEAVRAYWHYEYETTNPLLNTLIEQAALAEWFLRRANRRYHETEQKLYAEQPDFALWTDEQQKRIERVLRYRTTHERGFHRALADLEKMQKVYFKSRRELAEAKQACDAKIEQLENQKAELQRRELLLPSRQPDTSPDEPHTPPPPPRTG